MNYEIPEVAEFTEEIERLETSTPGHAKFFNAIYEKIFHNTLFLRTKTAVLETEIAKAIAIALGRNQALVFNTYDDMAAWFSDAANAENVAGLANGTNLYIIAKDVPDYWWSSVHQKYYELETQKVDLTHYDNIIGDTDISDIGDGTLTGGVKALNNNLGEISSNIGELFTMINADVICGNIDALGLFSKKVTLTVPDGYSALGTVGHRVTSGESTGLVSVRDAKVSDNSISVGIANPYNVTARNVKMEFDILCIKNTALFD